MSDTHFNPSEEVFKPIPGFPAYDIGNRGTVRSFLKQKREGWVVVNLPQKILNTRINRGGYPSVTLCNNGKRAHIEVHRLILLAFLGPPPPGHESCHKDGTPAHCFLDNLEWGTKSKNALDRLNHGRWKWFGMDHPSAKLTDQQVIRFREIAAQGHYSIIAIGRMFGIGRSSSYDIAHRKTWKHLP
jgi:hypothetical protein